MAGADGGRIVTFHSCTGGTGRSMALANTAWILASSGMRVLAVDWDLESPGLYRYFHPFFTGSEISATQGIVDLLIDYLRASVTPGRRSPDWHVEYARVLRHAFSLPGDKLFPDTGTLDYLSAGQGASQYAPADWEKFYKVESLNQFKFIDALRADMKRNYDYILIDSQIGLKETASVCAEVIPDIVVACFVLSDHSIDITAEFASLVRQGGPRKRHIRVFPVPMKIDPTEAGRSDIGRQIVSRAFAGFPNGLDEAEHAAYWAVAGIPYSPAAAFEENLAAFEDRREPPSLLKAYEWLASVITDGQVAALPPMEEQTRVHYRDAFTRKPPSASTKE